MDEIWLDVKNQPWYQVSSKGRVRSKDHFIQLRPNHGRIYKSTVLKGDIGKNGYVRVLLGNRVRLSVHRIVALAFIPNPNNLPQVNHINGVKSDNRVDNLEWCDASKNQIHRLYELKIGIGDSHHMSKLKECDIPIIRKLRKDGISHQKIGKIYGVSKKAILNIFKGKTWRHVLC